jgi:hypothetical protein
VKTDEVLESFTVRCDRLTPPLGAGVGYRETMEPQ